MRRRQSEYQEFLQNHRVFNTDELECWCSVFGHHARNLLSELVRERKVRKLRNCLYVVLPADAQEDFLPPALLVAAKLTPDAVLGYRSALAFHGMSRNAQSSHTFLSRCRIKSCRSGNTLLRPCLPPKPLARKDDFGVEEHTMWNTPVRVVCKERLLVDLLDRLDLSGGWEEIVNAYQYEDSLNWEKVVEYLYLLSHPTTAARVGFFLEEYQHLVNVPDDVLFAIEKLKPSSPQYFYRSNRHGKYMRRWNLYVLESMLSDDYSCHNYL